MRRGLRLITQHVIIIFFIHFLIGIKKEIERPNQAKTPRAVAPRRRCQPSRSGKQWKGGREHPGQGSGGALAGDRRPQQDRGRRVKYK